MFESFSKRISGVFKTFDKGFKELDEAVDQLDFDLAEKLQGSGIEHETYEEEKRPDGTTVTRRTVVRRVTK